MAQLSALFTTRQEQLIPVEGNIKGMIPTWVEGRLLRVGPGVFDIDNFTVNFYLDGFAMVSKFEIKNGKVSYSQKIVDSESYKKAITVKRPIFAEYGTHAYPDTTKGFLFRMFSTLVPTDLTDNCIAALYRVEEEIFIASQTLFVHTIDPDSLATKERTILMGYKIKQPFRPVDGPHDLMKLCGTMFSTAHPLNDSDGNLWNVGATMLTGCKYHVIRVPSIGSGKAADALKASTVVATIPSSWKTCLSFISSFVATESYIIFMEQPLLINCVKLAQIGIKGKSLKDTLEWTPSEKNRFIVVEKETGNVIKTKFISEDPFFVLHHINAFERDDQVVIDLIGYPNADILDKFSLSALRKNEFNPGEPSQTYRFVLPLIHFIVDVNEGENLANSPDVWNPDNIQASATRIGDIIVLKPQLIAEPGPEFPIINPRFAGKPYKFFYGSGMYGQGHFKNSVCKINVEVGNSKIFKARENEYCGEPVFIQKLDPTADEDDGLILVPVSCNDSDKLDYLTCLDSKTFQELGRAEFETKFVQSLHSIFIWTSK